MSDFEHHPQASAESADGIDTEVVRRLADILNDTKLTEIEVERGDLKIRVARKAPPLAQVAAAPIGPPAAVVVVPTAVAADPDTAPMRRGDIVASPMVGTVYLQPQPGAKPFIQVGERVNEGQTLLVVEAMKTLNPIPAPRAGVVTEILVEDAQPIEYGEALVVID